MRPLRVLVERRPCDEGRYTICRSEIPVWIDRDLLPDAATPNHVVFGAYEPDGVTLKSASQHVPNRNANG